MTGRRGLFEGLVKSLGKSLGIILEETKGADTLEPSFVPPAPETPGRPSKKVSPKPLPRPPGALPEAEFLTACTRCGACIEACPEETLQLHEDGYPVADIAKHPCILCTTTPCISACEPKALSPIAPAGIRFGTARVFARLCLNALRGPETPIDEDDPPCERCIEWCKVEGAIKLGTGGGVPIVDADKCTGCGLCVAHCKAYPQALGFEPRPRAERAASGEN